MRRKLSGETNGGEEAFKRQATAQDQPSVYARIRAAEEQEGLTSLEVGERTPEQESQLLDRYHAAGRHTARYGGVGIVARWRLAVQHRTKGPLGTQTG